MSKRIILIFSLVVVMFLSCHLLLAVEVRQEGNIVIPDRISCAMKIDGDLSEEAWNNTALSETFITFDPNFGEKLELDTKVWMVYDSRNLYFAFKCHDTEPDKIKTSISKRDSNSRDDWVGVILDATGNRQSSYEFYVNPNGMQDDGSTSAVTGWLLDIARDFVWESAAKITDEGYQVEICVPLESIRYKSGKEVKMGVVLMRNISRLGKMGSWPEIKVGGTQFGVMANIIYKDLQKSLKLEVLPNITYSRDVERESGGSWGDSDNTGNFGASFKYGISSSITTEATFNPDFSQVESDAFQVEVNRRYPIFFNEKRPFFMESMDVFTMGLIPPGLAILPVAVHTRRIVDPDWAAKFSGTAGKLNFAVLAANDNAPGQAFGGGAVNPHQGKQAFWGIARAKYNLGKDNSLGILYSGRHFAGGANNVFGADFQYRLSKSLRLKLGYLHSGTKDPGGGPLRNGNAFTAFMLYRTLNITSWAGYELYDKNFAMESAFLNRTNVGKGQFYIGRNFYMKKIPWFQRIRPYFDISTLHDMGTKMDDNTWGLGINMYFTSNAAINVEYRNEKEAWQGQLYNSKYLYTFGNIQLFKWLFLQAEYRFGDQIYYGPAEPFLGKGRQFTFDFIYQPNIKLSFISQWIHNKLSRKEDGINQNFYTVDIFNLLASYQFNKYFFVRGAVRYNDFQDKLLTDFLASFTLIPGTVVHLGYGSLYEKKEWQNNQWVPGQGGLLNMKNGLFFKVSYLWRIK